MAVKAVPEGMHSVTPRLFVSDARSSWIFSSTLSAPRGRFAVTVRPTFTLAIRL
jgi:hypothetical protein